MARRGRYFLPDQPLHVIQRGNNRAAIFFCDADYERYRAWLAEAAGGRTQMPSKREQKELNTQKAPSMEQKQTGAPFKFLVRPITTVNVSKGKLSNLFEDEVFSAFKDVTFTSPISGILVLPIIMDSSIAVPPRDRFVYQKRDNSVSVGIKIEFSLWEGSSVRERLDLLAENIKSSLSKIDSRYLFDEDRQKLLNIFNKVHAELASRL